MHSTPQQDTFSDAKNDELDLLVIARSVLDFLRQNKKKLLLGSLAGLFCGIILYFTFPKYYTARLLMESSVIGNTEAKTMVDNWNTMLRPSGYPYLMKEFNSSKKTVANALKLSAEPLSAQNESIPGFIIDVSVRDTSMLADLQTALLNGFNDNDYIRRRVEQHKRAAIAQIRKTEEELQKLDSTRQFIQNTVEGVKSDKSPLILDISSLPGQKVGLLERKTTLEEKLEFADGVLLIQGFSAIKGPKPGLATFLGVGLIGGFLIGYVLCLLASLNRKISKLKSN
jgi:hypothetical protein